MGFSQRYDAPSYGSPTNCRFSGRYETLDGNHVAAFSYVWYLPSALCATLKAVSAKPFLLFGTTVRDFSRKDLSTRKGLGLANDNVQEVSVVAKHTVATKPGG